MADVEIKASGIARNVKERQISGSVGMSQWNFRIEVTGEYGDVEKVIPVTLWGVLKGSLVDGDSVEVTGTIRPDGTLKPNKIKNITTAADVGESIIEEALYEMLQEDHPFGDQVLSELPRIRRRMKLASMISRITLLCFAALILFIILYTIYAWLF
jgi:hypothetical protein